MIVLLSPSKGQDFDQASPVKESSQPLLLKDSKQLVNVLRELDTKDIQKLMSVSENIANLNVDRYEKFKTPFTDKNAKQAIFAFKGDVYTGLAADTLTRDDFEFAQKHIRILSGLYGSLKPLDLIQPYRLEMKTKLKNRKGTNLYQFWEQKVTDTINADLGVVNSDAVINLASNEYYKVIQPKVLNANVITPHFKESKDGKTRVIGFYAKRARGEMANFIVQNKITHPEEIKNYDRAGYRYREDLSKNNDWVFERQQPEPISAKK